MCGRDKWRGSPGRGYEEWREDDVQLLRTAGLISAAGIATTLVIDRAIDTTGHAHDTTPYRVGTWPTGGLTYATLGLGALAAGAWLLPATRGAAKPLATAALATGIGLAATWGVRNLYGMTVSPSSLNVEAGDIAKNSVDRTFMMDRDLKWFERPVVDLVSRVQGHGPIDERIADGDFVERWTSGGRYDRAGRLVQPARAER